MVAWFKIVKCSPEGETSDLELYLRLGNCPTAPPTQVPSASPTVRVTQITTTVTTTTTTSTATTVTVPDPCMVLVRLALNDSELLEVCDRAERCTPQRNGGGMVCRQKTCTDFRISEACTNATWVGCDFDTNYSACHPAGEQVPCSSIQTEQADDCNNYTHPGASCIYVGGLCYDNNVDVPCSAYFDDATCPSSRCTFAFFNFESGYGECSATMTTQAPPVQTYNECELIPPTAMATCLNTADDLNCIFDYLLGDAGGCRSMSCRDHRDAEDCVSGTGCEYLDGFQLCHEVGAPVPCGSFQNNDTCDRTRCQYVGNTCHELGAVLPCWTYGRDAEACPTSPSDGQSDSRCAVMGGWCTAPLVSRSPSVAPTTAPSRVPTANPSPGRTTTTATTETSTSSTETSSTGMTTGTTETSTTTMATLTTATTGTTDTTATGDGMLVRTFLLVSDSNLASTLGQMGPAGRDQFGEQLGAAIAELVNSDDASSFNFKAEQVQVSNIRADVNVVELSVTARDPILIESVIHKMARLLGLQAGPFVIAPLGVGDSGDGSGLATPQTTTSDSSAAWTDASQDAEDSTSDWSKSAVYALVVGGSCALFLVVVLANTMCVRSGSRGAEDVTGKDDAKAFGFGNPGFKQTLASSSLREVFGSSLNLDPYSSLEPHSVDNSSPDPYDTNNFGTPTPRASPAALWDQVLAVRPQMPTVESVTEAKSVTVNKQTGIKPGSLGLKFGPTPGIGLRVNGVTEGASAALTGQIAVGDVIQFINGIDVRNMQMADVMPILGQREAVVLRIVGSTG